jgi:outer membrane protein assembly factor BamE (lipoprotein component of BamABCDE complex)
MKVILVLLLAFSFGCGSLVVEGRKIDAAKLKQLQPGVTQVQKVEELFGKPDKVENLPRGGQSYVYNYVMKESPWFTSEAVDNQRLEVAVQDGVVQAYRLRTQGKETILKE